MATNFIQKQQAGQNGSVIGTGTTINNGNFGELVFITSGAISNLVAPALSSTSLTALYAIATIPAGFSLKVPFTSVTFTGSAIAYKA